jgi:hypothetical protein
MGPRAKFSKYGLLFYFFLFLILQTIFVPNFMFLGLFFPILLRKTEKTEKGPQAKILQWALGLNFQDMAYYFVFSYFLLYKLYSYQISCF